MTPVTASFKRRQNKTKCKLIKIAEEKEKLESTPESIPIQHRLGPFKKLRFAGNIDDSNESCHLSTYEQEFIAPAPVQVMDETPSTSRGKSQSKSILSRLGGERPILGEQRLGERRGILKRRLGVVHKECPWENRLGSQRYNEDPTGTWDDGSTELWDDVIAGHKNQGSSSGFYPEERTGRRPERTQDWSLIQSYSKILMRNQIHEQFM